MATSAAERMRRMRERRRTATGLDPILFERADWRLFIDRQTLPQKAGCEPNQLGWVVAKELVDNALDAGAAEVAVTGDRRSITVSDDGPGIDPERITQLFAVNRPLLSSKLKRLPTRGMLGNGLRVVMGAVVAFGGRITVETRGQHFRLAVDPVTGETSIAETLAPPTGDTTVHVEFPSAFFGERDLVLTRKAIALAKVGWVYSGPSHVSWYDRDALRGLFTAATNGATVRDVVHEVFGIDWDDDRPARDVDVGQVSDLELSDPIGSIGMLGEAAFDGEYSRVEDVASIGEASIPFTVEAWCTAKRAERDEGLSWIWHPHINRSLSLAPIYHNADSTGLRLSGCGLDFKVQGAKRADYDLEISLITPFVRLTGDGKAPFLADFREAIEKAMGEAARRAYRHMVRPPASMSIADAAYLVMREAYLKASGGSTLPAKARQIMYAARPQILAMAGVSKFSDSYFTQTLLPDYIDSNPDETNDWDVVYDARGHLTEPHTGRSIPLGTLQVRAYLGERPELRPAVEFEPAELCDTKGPQSRYRNALFIEKEGFDELFQAVALAERYDLAIFSTKGLSVTAARKLIDGIAPHVDHIFTLHDFDVSGFSIAGTLGTDSRRYVFDNEVSSKLIDIGLRLEDIDGLQSEIVDVTGSRAARRVTLYERGATSEEVDFLCPLDGDEECHRVELNAMTSPQLVTFIETKLAEHGVKKVIPDKTMLEEHARRLVEQGLAKKLLVEHADELAKQAKAIRLPRDLQKKITELLGDSPELPWDAAIAKILTL